ncbi:DNA starvation/stationary phase protection protein [Cryomorpha ignava]|uniref:DNA starvation/stationary phase protection protein n=1 Tax=Cryomorpha ignava TaxID=101383 RepID=A0A7K3WKX9_9FLAO|nr:Dps family protein [Cryomorpha ignava]NEN22188.1 DNA starvation/stationary phase protection protein [Cryomorpha ignava]
MATESKEKTYSKLGFNREEASELAESLNLLLCNYSVVYQKIRNFHWNVVGGDFFDVHEKLEEEYLSAAENIDTVAERVRVLGFKPISTLAEYLEKAEVEEVTGDLSSDKMMEEVIQDYEVLLSFMVDVADLAVENGDLGTETIMRSMIIRTEGKHWMFSAFVKK